MKVKEIWEVVKPWTTVKKGDRFLVISPNWGLKIPNALSFLYRSVIHEEELIPPYMLQVTDPAVVSKCFLILAVCVGRLSSKFREFSREAKDGKTREGRIMELSKTNTEKAVALMEKYGLLPRGDLASLAEYFYDPIAPARARMERDLGSGG